MALYLYGSGEPTFEYAFKDLQESNFELIEKCCILHSFYSTVPNILPEHIMYEQYSEIEKKLNQEPNIFAIRYSDRVDLLTVMLIGAKGTPYHLGLFFFDFYIHSEFPAEPPKVQSLSYVINNFSPDNWDDVEKLCGVNHVPRGINLMIDYLSECLKRTESRAHNTLEYIHHTVRTMKSVIYMPPTYFIAVVYQHFKHHEKTIMYEFMAYLSGSFEVGRYEEKTGVLDERVNKLLEGSGTQYIFETLRKALKHNIYENPFIEDYEKKWDLGAVRNYFVNELKENSEGRFKFLDDFEDAGEVN